MLNIYNVKRSECWMLRAVHRLYYKNKEIAKLMLICNKRLLANMQLAHQYLLQRTGLCNGFLKQVLNKTASNPNPPD